MYRVCTRFNEGVLGAQGRADSRMKMVEYSSPGLGLIMAETNVICILIVDCE